MKSDSPYFPGKNDQERELKEPSKFIDEKISDDSGFETVADSALKPAGLKNPFWN